jgi:hypothetical protein
MAWGIILRVKHLEKFCSVCGGHLISINLPPRNWEGYYAYLVGVRTLLLQRVGIISLLFIGLMTYIGMYGS